MMPKGSQLQLRLGVSFFYGSSQVVLSLVRDDLRLVVKLYDNGLWIRLQSSSRVQGFYCKVFEFEL